MNMLDHRHARKVGLVTVPDADGRHRFVLEVSLTPAQNPNHHLTVDHQSVPEGAVNLSMTGEVVNLRYRKGSAHWEEGCGQNVGELRRLAQEDNAQFDDGFSREWCLAAADLWDRWHLNEMRAACAHQVVEYETDRYGRRVPSLDLTPACPESGYRYGHAWLFEPLPDDVLAWVRAFLAGHLGEPPACPALAEGPDDVCVCGCPCGHKLPEGTP